MDKRSLIFWAMQGIAQKLEAAYEAAIDGKPIMDQDEYDRLRSMYRDLAEEIYLIDCERK